MHWFKIFQFELLYRLFVQSMVKYLKKSSFLFSYFSEKGHVSWSLGPLYNCAQQFLGRRRSGHWHSVILMSPSSGLVQQHHQPSCFNAWRSVGASGSSGAVGPSSGWHHEPWDQELLRSLPPLLQEPTIQGPHIYRFHCQPQSANQAA